MYTCLVYTYKVWIQGFHLSYGAKYQKSNIEKYVDGCRYGVPPHSRGSWTLFFDPALGTTVFNSIMNFIKQEEY